MSQENKLKINPLAAGLAGLAVGVAAGATVTVLSDPKARQKAKQQAKKVYRHTSDRMQQTWKQVEPEIRQTGQQLKSGFKGADARSVAHQNEIAELATKGGEVIHQADDVTTEQFKNVKDLMNH
jgi:gas vesicle protein